MVVTAAAIVSSYLTFIGHEFFEWTNVMKYCRQYQNMIHPFLVVISKIECAIIVNESELFEETFYIMTLKHKHTISHMLQNGCNIIAVKEA